MFATSYPGNRAPCINGQVVPCLWLLGNTVVLDARDRRFDIDTIYWAPAFIR